MNARRFLTVLFLGLLLAPAPAYADQLNFTVTSFPSTASNPSPGNIAYAGGSSALVGTNIQIQDVSGVGTPSNSGMTFNLVNAVLNFTTGAFSGYSSSSWFFNPGGSISLIGGVDFNGDGDADDPGDIAEGTTLFSGTFTNSAVVTNGPELKLVIALFSDQKNADLVDFFGLPTTAQYLGSMEIVFDIHWTQPGWAPPEPFSSWTILQGQLTNTPIPEPGTLVLFGTGLLGMAGLLRRRIRS